MNMAYRFKTVYKQLLADTTTPVSTYLRLRDVFPNSLLLESSDYHSRENNMSYICCQPIAGIKLDRDTLEIQYPGLPARSEEHTSELQSLMRISYAVFCLKKKKTHNIKQQVA